MRLGLLIKSLALASVIPLIGTGCGGIYAEKSVSPLMFLLPGIGQAKPALTPPQTAPLTPTAPNRDLAEAN